MRTSTLVFLAAATLAVLCATCAPVDPPATVDPPLPPPAPIIPKDAEPLTHRPQAVPASLKHRIEAAVQHVRQRDMLTTNAFWTVFHGILGLGPNVPLRDPETGKRYPALDYVCSGGEIRGMVFLPTRHGLEVQTGPMSVGQGHQDQFIAEMAQWGIPADRKFVVLGRDYTYMDFVRHAQMRAQVTSNQELSWTIIVVGQYLGTDVEWTNIHGEKLSFQDMVRYEVDASIEQAACGGTHRLFGLSWVYHLHLQKGGKTVGVWKDLADKTARYRDLARKFQNPDGSFSTDFFRGPGNAPDRQLRINTTGHILEWLALALSEDELRAQWVQDAANALSLMILDLQGSPIESGSLYHATHGLLMYYARVFDRETLGPPELFMQLPPAGKQP
jgi:hypothetical protein